MVSEIERTRDPATNVRRGLVLGCGGTLGAAWSTAVLVEVSRRLQWDPREARVIYGTSAGATLATLLAAGLSVEAVLAAALGAAGADPLVAAHFASPPPALPMVPRGGPSSLARVAGLLSGLAPMTALSGLLPEGRGDTRFLTELAAHVAPNGHLGRARLVACDTSTGRRVVFGSKGAPEASLGEALRASWAIPGWFPSVAIGGRRYLDGGVCSPTSADLAALDGVDELVVIAPMTPASAAPRGLATAPMSLLRAAMRATLDAELTEAERAGVRVLRIEPLAEDLAAFGPNLMDGARRLRVLESSLRTARRNVGAALACSSFTRPAPTSRHEGAFA